MEPLNDEALDALYNLLVSAVDQRLGYRDRDLHEAWRVTQARARSALCKAGRSLDGLPTTT